MSKRVELDQLAQEIRDKNICPELAATAQNLVMGDGNLNAEMVFIGEAPGKREDEQGLPFIGAAGKFLNAMLETVGLERKDVYITNIVKYRPPDNRDPTADEKAAFWPYLVRQLQIINPKIIITLGRHSMGYFLPGVKIGDVHGKPERIDFGGEKIVILPLFHPAAALYNGSLRQTLLEDFQRVPKVIEQL